MRGPDRKVGMHPDRCRLLRVTATTPHGAVLPSVFPAPLDGILASSARSRLLGSSRPVDHHVVDLPLASTRFIRGQPWGNQWVWAASCAMWRGSETDLRYVHQRWDDAAGERVVIDRLPASTDVGRYKPWRIPVVAELTWWAIGDRDGVADLLDWRVGVGKRRGSGEGVVTAWVVEDAGPADLDRILWTDSQSPARPIPARTQVLASLGLPAAVETVPHQIRPPYWRAAQTTEPGAFGRAPREVLAPWISRQPACMPA